MPPDLLAAFAEGLRTGALPDGVTAHADVARRFDVYRNNVAHSLGRALAARYPAIERLIGAAASATLAHAFATAHRPPTPILSQWGADFADMLAGHSALAAYPYLADVARIEWARGIAYHAADVDPVPASLLAAAAADAGRTRLGLHPSLTLVASPYPAASIWAAQQPGATGKVTARGAETAAILRNAALEVQVWPLPPGDAAMLSEMLRGETLLAAAESGAAAQPGHDPGALLLRLAAAGVLIAIGDLS